MQTHINGAVDEIRTLGCALLQQQEKAAFSKKEKNAQKAAFLFFLMLELWVGTRKQAQ
jgi:hypothetical protein